MKLTSPWSQNWSTSILELWITQMTGQLVSTQISLTFMCPLQMECKPLPSERSFEPMLQSIIYSTVGPKDVRALTRSNSNDGHCCLLSRTTSDFNVFEQGVSGCLDESNFICEHHPGLEWVPAALNLTDLDTSKVLGYYSTSMNSATSCLAYCAGKENVQSSLINKNKCYCFSGIAIQILSFVLTVMIMVIL